MGSASTTLWSEGAEAVSRARLSVDAYRQVRGRLDLAATDLGPTELKNQIGPVSCRGVTAILRATSRRGPRPVMAAIARAASHRAAAEHHGKNDHTKGHEHSTEARKPSKAAGAAASDEAHAKSTSKR